MEKQLTVLGLTENESRIYIYLLKRGSTTTGSIIRETHIANSRVYESLNSLIGKGLATYTVEKDGKHFAAADPKAILEREEERRKHVEKMVPQLSKLQHTVPPTFTAVYEDFDGFRAAFRKIIDDCPREGTIRILGFSEQEFANKSLRTFLTNMNLKSAEKKQRLKVLLPESARTTLGKDRVREKHSEVRYLPQDYISPAAVDIFDDYVYTFLWEEKPFVFMMRNARIAESYRQYFDLLWKMSKK